jgi:hypothetical protein
MATKTKTKASKAVEEDLELEDLDEDVEETETSAKAKKGTTAKESITFGVPHLSAYLTEKTGKTVTGRELRAQIRRMARDDSGRVNREITQDNRSRYDWPKGLKDPEVKAIIAAYEDGEPEVAKQKALADLKERGAKKKKDKAAKAGKTKKTKVVEPDDEDDFEVDDDE